MLQLCVFGFDAGTLSKLPVLNFITPSHMEVTIEVVKWLVNLHVNSQIPVCWKLTERHWGSLFSALDASIGLAPTSTLAIVKLMRVMLKLQENRSVFLATKGANRVLEFVKQDTRKENLEYQEVLLRDVLTLVTDNQTGLHGTQHSTPHAHHTTCHSTHASHATPHTTHHTHQLILSNNNK